MVESDFGLVNIGVRIAIWIGYVQFQTKNFDRKFCKIETKNFKYEKCQDQLMP